MILTETETQALKQARRIKAFQIRNSDNEKTFSDIYYNILHEVNLYDNNEETNQLTKSSAASAKVWLLRYSKLLITEKYLVEVIRCKQCKHFTNNINDSNLRNGYCNRKEVGSFCKVKDDGSDYCSYAVPK